MIIALDATYSLGEELSGVGIYSARLLGGLAEGHPEARFLYCYRPHRFLRSWRERLPGNCRRSLLQEPWGPRRADLFHGLNQRLPRLRLRRAVTTFHDLFVLTGDYSTPEFRCRFAEQARHAAAESDAILTVSAFTAGQVEQLLGVERARIHVVHHGAPAPPESAVREPLILHVGAIQRRKNIVRLVEAFETVDPPWRLVLAGGRGYGAEEILRRIEESPSRGRIQVCGYVRDVRPWYARASVFAFPSLDEGFGMPVLEAMAAGVPVLTSSRSALPEVAGDAALLVDPEDAAEIGGALRKLTLDEGLREDLRIRGLARARNFTWAKAAGETWQVYEAVLSGNRRPRRSSGPAENGGPGW